MTTTTTTITIIMGPFRFLLYAVHSGPLSIPSGEVFFSSPRSHCISQTRNPGLYREGHFTFVECPRRCITFCTNNYGEANPKSGEAYTMGWLTLSMAKLLLWGG